MKRFCSVCMVLILCFILSVGAYAGDVSVNWYQTSDTGNGLYVEGQQLTINGFTSGHFGVDSCDVIALLQKKVNGSWTDYQTWSEESTTSWPDYVSLEEIITVSSGQYRLVTYHSVTYKGSTECSTMVSPTRTVY